MSAPAACASVSVEKTRALQTACTTPVVEGMVVDTESEEARDTRRFVLQMLLTDHPNDCMKCEVDGECELQDLVVRVRRPLAGGGREASLLPGGSGSGPVHRHRPEQVRTLHPLRAHLRRDAEPGCVEHRHQGVREQVGGGRRPVSQGSPLRELRRSAWPTVRWGRCSTR